MDPISTGLAGMALVQKSVELIKSNISTANDIRDIAGAIDGLFAGEKQVQKERFGGKSVLGQTKDVAHSVIDAKLAQEQMQEISVMIDNRFGYGTWRQIVSERAKRIQDEKMAIKKQKAAARKKREEFEETLTLALWVLAGIFTFGAVAVALILWLR
jgi:hypothetical protein